MVMSKQSREKRLLSWPLTAVATLCRVSDVILPPRKASSFVAFSTCVQREQIQVDYLGNANTLPFPSLPSQQMPNTVLACVSRFMLAHFGF